MFIVNKQINEFDPDKSIFMLLCKKKLPLKKYNYKIKQLKPKFALAKIYTY